MTTDELGFCRKILAAAVLVGLSMTLGACGGIKPMTSYPVPGSEMDPTNRPGLISGDDGAIILYEKK
jgi:hypothetical protein